MSNARQRLTATVYDKRGRVLSQANNSYIKTHPYQAKLAERHGRKEQIYLHAEIAALVKLRGVDKAHRIVVERYLKDGTPANAKPCPICEEAIRLAGIKIVEHT